MMPECRDFGHLKQGSERWHDFRRGHHMASHAAIVMGDAPSYWNVRTENDLRAYNEGAPQPVIDAKTQELFDAAHAAEEWIRDRISATEFCNYMPTVYERGKYGASLDGYDPVGLDWIEVKMARHQNSRVWRDVGLGEVPPHMMWQLVHQAYCVPEVFEKCRFIVVRRKRNGGYDWRQLFIRRTKLLLSWPRLQDAWERFDSGEREAVEVNTRGYLAANSYVRFAKELEDAKARLEMARDALLAHGEAEYPGLVKVTKYVDKGRVNYRAAAEEAYADDLLALEKYRAAPQERHRITIARGRDDGSS